MHGHHEQLERVRGDDGHEVAPPRLDDVLFGPAGDDIKALIASGDKEAARILVRRLSGCSPQEAADLVARVDIQLNPQAYPEIAGGARAAPGGSTGVLAIIALVIVVLVLLAILQAS
jgi:hypothetical protein